MSISNRDQRRIERLLESMPEAAPPAGLAERLKWDIPAATAAGIEDAAPQGTAAASSIQRRTWPLVARAAGLALLTAAGLLAGFALRGAREPRERATTASLGVVAPEARPASASGPAAAGPAPPAAPAAARDPLPAVESGSVAAPTAVSPAAAAARGPLAATELGPAAREPNVAADRPAMLRASPQAGGLAAGFASADAPPAHGPRQAAAGSARPDAEEVREPDRSGGAPARSDPRALRRGASPSAAPAASQGERSQLAARSESALAEHHFEDTVTVEAAAPSPILHAATSLSTITVASALEPATGAAAEAGFEAADPWRRSTLAPNTSRLRVGDAESLPLEGLQITARVDGFRARVALDLYYFNPTDEELEGTLELRLPDGATPFYLAFGGTRAVDPDLPAERPRFLDPDELAAGALDPEGLSRARRDSWQDVREARMAPRAEAARSYAATTRRRVDPALLEWSGAGIFSARVYPLAPQRLHRIVIAYDVDLERRDGNLELVLEVPPEVANAVVAVAVSDLPGARVSVFPEARAERRAAATWYRFEGRRRNPIRVRLKEAPLHALTGNDPETGDYFAVRFDPRLPATGVARSAGRAIFMLDVSLSSSPEQLATRLELLLAILEANRPALREFAVLFFDIDRFWWRPGFTPNTPAAAAELAAYAASVAVVGATDLGAALAEAAEPPFANDQAVDIFLLSDGAPSWGERDATALAARLARPDGHARQRLFAYHSGEAGTDADILGRLARESGGGLFHTRDASQLAALATAHRVEPWRLESVELEGTSDLVLAGRPRALFPGQELLLVGRGRPGPRARLSLEVSDGRGLRRRFEARLERVVDSPCAARLYGRVAVLALEELGQRTAAAARPYAQHFRIVGPSASLVLLDSDEDYAALDLHPEADAEVVATRPVTALLDEAQARLGAERGDSAASLESRAAAAKASFMARLETLDAMNAEGVLSEAVRGVFDAMPAQLFQTEIPALAGTRHTWQELPAGTRELLAERPIDSVRLRALAERLRTEATPADALRLLSARAERDPSDLGVARELGITASAWGLPGAALAAYDQCARARPDEPHGYLGMARSLQELGAAELASACYELVLAADWDARFGAVAAIAARDYARLLRSIARGALAADAPDQAPARLSELAADYAVEPADLVVTIDWSTDRTDVDLHVVEPSGEVCAFNNPDTAAGGHLSDDVTDGYGPELYSIASAPAGSYRIAVHYYADDELRTSTRTSVGITIVRDDGRPTESITRSLVLLAETEDEQEVALLELGPSTE